MAIKTFMVVGAGQMIHAPYSGTVVSYGPISGAWIGGHF